MTDSATDTAKNDSGQADPVENEAHIGRSSFLRGGIKAAIGLTAVPLVLKAFEQTAKADPSYPPRIILSLNSLLPLEYLTQGLYRAAVDTPGFVPEAELDAIKKIRNHEEGHVNTLQNLLGGNAIPEPNLDFNGGGQFAPFASFEKFLQLAQGLEDLSVRAYQGQLQFYLGFPDTLTTLLEIHSTEARHAAHIRQVRGLSAFVQGAEDPLLGLIYLGEDDEPAFDEGLTEDQVKAFLAAFIR